MAKLPITVIVAHRKDRKEFFEGFCLPSIEANGPERIVVADEEGVPAAIRNKAAKGVSTPYMFHADDDLILRKDCLRKMWEALEAHRDYAFSYCDILFVTLEDAPPHPYPSVLQTRPGPFDALFLRQRNYIDTSSLVRTKLFPGFDEDPLIGRLHDWELWLRMAEKGHKGFYIPETLYHAYNTDAGLTATQSYDEAYARIRRKFNLKL